MTCTTLILSFKIFASSHHCSNQSIRVLHHYFLFHYWWVKYSMRRYIMTT